VAATDSTRGKRFNAGLMEECVGIDQDILKTVIIPTMNVDRMVAGNCPDPNEQLNQSQIYITTAGYKGTFGYDQLIQILCQSVARPKKAIVLGGSWRVPVSEGLLGKNFIDDLRADGTFNEASFEREYESIWTGDVESAFFNVDKFDKHRVIKKAETKYSNKIGKNGYYVMGVDVGRKECTTEIVILKVTPCITEEGLKTLKQVVNIITLSEEHFGMQAIKLKRIFRDFKCRIAVVDGNGLGQGLVDALTVDTLDPETGETLYNWGVYNDPNGTYKNLQTQDTIHNAMYIMKANQTINSECYSYCQTELSRGHLKFLIDDMIAKDELIASAGYSSMSAGKVAEYLKPYVNTSILREQILNLVETRQGAHIILEQNNRSILKDKFSALIYGLYYCKLEEDRNARKKTRNIEDFMFFN
jgi:hypothetical protein